MTIMLITAISLSACGKQKVEEEKTDVSEAVEAVEEVETTEEVTEEPSEEVTETTEEETVTTIRGVYDFGNATNNQKSAYILDNLYMSKDDNVILSPLSLNMVLGMISNGANGDTKEALEQYLDTKDFNSVAEKIMKYYNDATETSLEKEVYTQIYGYIATYGIDEEQAGKIAAYLTNEFKLTDRGTDNSEYEDIYNEFYDSLYDDDKKALDDKIFSLYEYIEENSLKDTSRFNVANSVWVNDHLTIDDTFKQMVEEKYKAQVDTIDVNSPKYSVDKVNEWCSIHTKGLIPSILNEEAITPDTASVLVNTVYFNSQWKDEWNEKEITFNNIDNSVYEGLGIRNEVNRYYESDKATAFGCYYRNGFEFIGILPNKEGNFNVEDLNIDDLLGHNCTDDYDKVYAEMPKIKFETDNNILKNTLSDLGLSIIFEPSKAEFTKLVKEDSCYVSDIIQKCTIDLDQYGTEASAATAATMKCYAGMPVEFDEQKVVEVILDRPFAFVIMDRETDQIAFMGKVVNIKGE